MEGTGAAKSALEELGLSANKLKLLRPEEQFEQIADSLARVENQSNKVRLAMKLFDTEGVALLQTMENGADGIRKFREEARKLGASLSSEEIKAMTEFNNELTKIQAVMSALITSCLLPILPTITAFFEGIRDGNPVITFLLNVLASLVLLRLATWFISSAAAVKAFTLALMANPIGLVATSISLAVAALVSLYRWFNKSTDAAKKHNKVLEESKKVSADLANIKDKYIKPQKELNDLLLKGADDYKNYNNAMLEQKELLTKTTTANEEIFNLLATHSRRATDHMINNFARSAFSARSHSNSIKDSFKNMFAEIQSDLLKLTLKQGLSSLFDGFGNSNFKNNRSGFGKISSLFSRTGNLFGGFFASGGIARPGKAHIVGDGGEPELFIPNRIGTIIPSSNMPATAGNINVNMNIKTPDINSFNHSKSQIAADMARQISQARRNL